MKKSLFLIVFIVASFRAYCQTDFSLSEAGKNLVCTSSFETGGDDKMAFSNAVLWCINNGAGIAETFVSRDFSKYKFMAKMERSSKENEKKAISFILKVQARDGHISYTITEVKVYDFLPIPSPVERYYPPSKSKHEEVLAWVNGICSETMNDLIGFVESNQLKFSDRWDAVCRKKVEPGMTEDECVLILGKPINKQGSGGREQWMYDPSIYVIFEGGIVKTLLD